MDTTEVKNMLAAIVDGSDDAIASTTLDGIVTSWNRGAESIYGYTAAEMIGQSVFLLVPIDRAINTTEILQKIARGERVVHYEAQRIRKDGQKIDVSLTVSPLMNSKGEVIGASSIARDITEKKRAERNLSESEERYRFLFMNSPTAMLVIDIETGMIVDANPKASLFYGYRHEELTRLKISDINTLPAEQVQAEMKRALAERQTYFRFQHKLSSGEIRDVEVYSGPVMIDGKQLLFSVIHDETKRKRAEAKIHHLAFHDSLTDLPNRHLFFNRLAQAIQRSKRFQQITVILYLDLDGFKGINDTLGHEAGDAVLTETARRLRRCIRATDTAARLGGDEFAVILQDVQEKQFIEMVARRLVKSISQPISFKEKLCRLGVSIGISLYPFDSQDVDDLLRKADEAMYVAKTSQKSSQNSYLFYESISPPSAVS